MMARVAVVGPFAVAIKGSVRYRALPIAAELARHGHDVRAFLPAWDALESVGLGYRWHGVVLEHHPSSGTPTLLRTLTELTSAVVRWHPDIAYVFKPKGFSGGVQFFVHLLRSVGRYRGRLWLDRDDWETGWNRRLPYSRWQKLLFRWQESWGTAHADLVTVASRWLLEQTVSSGVPSDRVLHVPNGIMSQWATVRRRPIPGLLLWYTRFTDARPEFVLRMFRTLRPKVPTARLWVMGRGFYGEERGVEGVPHVRYMGWGDATLRRRTLALASAVIFPMDDDDVNRARCPARLLEATAAGAPVVASDVGEIRRMLADGRAGVLVPPGDAGAFAEAVAGLLRNQAAAERLGRNALRSARGMTWSRVAAGVVAAASAM